MNDHNLIDDWLAIVCNLSTVIDIRSAYGFTV